MLVNGREVFDLDYNLTTLQSYNIQQRINAEPQIGSDEKSDATVVNSDIVSSERNGIGSYSPAFQLGMFETIGSTTAKRTVRDRLQLYETYIKMGTLGLVQRALEVISDEASQKNDDNEVLYINSNNEKTYNALRALFFDKLSMNTELWPIFFETLKMGDCFYEVSLEVKNGKATGIKRIKYLDPSKVEVHEKDGRIDYYIYKSGKKENQIEQKLFPWQILHFKVENKETKPYGKSLLYSGIRSYERLTATEDIFLTYTISRTPNRRVFKIDVGGLPQLEAQRAIREIRDNYRSQQVIDNEGNLNQISSILSITSDIFIPVREGQNGTTIETLQGDSMNMNQNMTFLDNFKKDLVASFNVPIEYLDMSTASTDRSTTLSQKDIKFGRFVERIQQQILKTLYKLATLELFFNGFSGDDLKNFTLELTPPSTTKEASETGLLETKIGLLSQMQQLNIFPEQWLLKKVLKLSDKEISEIQFMKAISEKENEAAMAAAQGGAGTMPAIPELGNGEAGLGTPETAEAGNENPETAPEGNNEIETPTEGPAEAGLETSEVHSYLNVEGQKFLIEDKNDFLTLMKYINEQKKFKAQKTSEFMAEVNSLGKRKASPKIPNPYIFLENSNEFGGLEIKTGKVCSMYESDGTTKKILCD